MHLFAFGINHRTAPLSVRERVVFHAEKLSDALRELVDRRPVREAAIVSTCNRTEIYCSAADPRPAIDWMAGYHELKPQQIEPYLYTLPREQAVKHAFRVASGLDSMVLGETQILGQFKDAMRSAEQAGTLGLLLNKLFQHTFSVAKAVRTHTDIGASKVSVASCAVRLAERIYPSIGDQRVLFTGAGEMIELAAAHFAAHAPRAMTFANRTLQRAQELALRFNGNAISLNDLPAQLAQHDIVVASTASQLPIIGKGLVERAIRARKHRPMLMLDLAVPRDIEAEVAGLDDVFLYTIDELGRIANEGLRERQAAVVQAESIIDTQVADFMGWVEGREAVPAIRALRDTAERFRRHEVDRAVRRLARGDNPQQVMEQLSRALTNKFMHVPTQALSQARGDERHSMASLLHRLFQINPPE
ncbi:MAG TPA: glutamyl-tRNA reductase [Burkholderiales bacterium]|nr:glutamyl-tRNA reductase [Burkholderiales bacterium]